MILFFYGTFKGTWTYGLYPIFYQKHWQWLGPSLLSMMIHDFFLTSKLQSSINDTSLILIPKVENVTHPTKYRPKYRPISLCNTSYKIISKNLATRLKPFLQSLISPQKSVFSLFLPSLQICLS